jgi:hypothetical protein
MELRAHSNTPNGRPCVDLSVWQLFRHVASIRITAPAVADAMIAELRAVATSTDEWRAGAEWMRDRAAASIVATCWSESDGLAEVVRDLEIPGSPPSTPKGTDS